jgi:hypothetical protein
MTEKELRDKVIIRRLQQCSYRVTIKYYGKEYHCVSNNSLAWDDLDSEGKRSFYSTNKECLKAFYNECKIVNGLR